MRKLFVSAFAFFQVLGRAQDPAQNPGNLPSIIPPSPEVSSLVKAGALSTSLHTGAASVSIPLYEMKVGDITLPISLSYSTNGTKVNEIPGRVGMGWNLVAGGSVSKIVHDEEDDNPMTIYLDPSQIQELVPALQYALYANIENYDTEFDEYAYSVNGLSGKFFLGQNGLGKVADHNNFKITKEADGFTIITGDGTKYEFGKNFEIEKTKDVKTNGNPRAHKVKKTAFFLTRITSLTGHQINFVYRPISTKANMGPFQSVILKPNDPLYPNHPVPNCVALCQGQMPNTDYSRVDYDTYYLSEIHSSNGIDAYFLYEDRPDASGDNRLILLTVSTANGFDQPKVIVKYGFEYLDYTVGLDLNQRFYLKKLIQKTNESVPQTIEHEFQYNNPATLPSQESKDQDYYGYHNGPVNNTHYFPRPENYQNYVDGHLGANRTPDLLHTKAGTLSKVIYPTGGYQEFEYESHTIATALPGSSSYTGTVNFPGVTGPGPIGQYLACDMSTYTQQFQVDHPSAHVSFTTEWNTNGPAQGSASACNPDGIHFLSYLEIWDIAANTRVFEARHKMWNTTETFNIFLQPGVNYEVRLKVKGLSTKCFATIQYNPVFTPGGFMNTAVCGLRVKNIKSYDPVATKSEYKYFTYASIDNLLQSSGIGAVKPVFDAPYAAGGYCQDATVYDPEDPYFIWPCPPGMWQVSASALSGKFEYHGSPVAYTHVIESDDLNFVNGGIQHKYFTVNQEVVPIAIHNQSVVGFSGTALKPDVNGTELQTIYFKKDGSNYIVFKQIDNEFGFDTRVGENKGNYFVRQRWALWSENMHSPFINLSGYDINAYSMVNRWYHLNKTTTKDFDQLGLNPSVSEVNYQYDNTGHLQPTKVISTNSKGETVSQEMKYSGDYSVYPFSNMASVNDIATLVEKKELNSNIQVSLMNNSMTGWNNNSFFKTQVVNAISGNSVAEPRVQYHNYDNAGNVTEVSKQGDIRISYIYNYRKAYPVAEVKNALENEIAYTSFEGDDNGGWVLFGSKASGGVSGRKQYSGSMSRTNSNTTLPYIITAWVKGSMTVNGNAGTLILTIGVWKLYKWTIPVATSNISISATEVDEVRMHPEKASMTTLTYDPFIGVTSTIDVNNRITYYEYDGFNRLRLVLDQDKNVLKRLCYNYASQNENCTAGTNGCSNTLPNWQNTNQTRCQLNSIGENTGYSEYEQKDMNTCSPSYLQTQWLQGGYDPESCTVLETVPVTSFNPNGLSGFVATYTNRTTNAVTQFNIPTATTVQTLGTLTVGRYDLVISNPNNNILLLFGTGCIYQDGITSVTFYNVNITNCHAISIEWNL